MRDEACIKNFERCPQSDSVWAFFFGGTTVVAEVWEDLDGDTHLRPVRGDQVACGEWYDLDDEDVAAYCEMIEDEIRRRNRNEESE